MNKTIAIIVAVPVVVAMGYFGYKYSLASELKQKMIARGDGDGQASISAIMNNYTISQLNDLIAIYK